MKLPTAIREARLRAGLPHPSARRALRVKAGLSQQTVADIVGASRAAVCRWETGSRVPRGQLLRAYTTLLERLNALETSSARVRSPAGGPGLVKRPARQGRRGKA